jgi:putative transposase
MRRRGAPGEARFLTCSCRRGERLLQGRTARDAIVRGLRAMVEADACTLHAWVIMGNHMHLLLTPRQHALVDSLAALKAQVACAIVESLGETQQIWEHGGGFDRLVWSPRAYWNIFESIHLNPVRAGLGATPLDWQWSSARDWRRPRRGTPTLRHPGWISTNEPASSTARA